ncbi:MAG: general secretion pathway protein GspK [Planctomycetaceae bacterium]|jgi:hypothetical protein|nr:general secretion pathway protein GspK [Planctomycetaceae bacterium]
MILFLVSIIIAMLAVGSLSLLALLTTEYEAALFRGDEIQASQLVQSGIEFIGHTLQVSESSRISETNSPEINSSELFYFSQQNSAEYSQHYQWYDNPVQFCGIEVISSSLGRFGRGAGRFSVVSPRIEQGQLKGIRFGLVNESTRLHLGSVLEWERESSGQGLQALLKLPGMTPTMAESILDWIDADKVPRSSGAELDYYAQTGAAYRPRNTLPATLEELLLVRDVTRLLLFGNDEHFFYGATLNDLKQVSETRNLPNDLLFRQEDGLGTRNEMVSAEFLVTEPVSFFEDSLGTGGANTTRLPWCFLLTTLSAEKLVDPATGDAKIFLNDNNLEFLEEQLRNKLDEESCRFILAWRNKNGLLDDPVDLLDAVIKEAEEELRSPFSLEDSVGEEKFLTLLDVAATQSDVVISGRINVNEAPAVVLEAVPELDRPTVLQIINRRGNPGEKQQGKYRHLVWLLSEKIVDKETMKKLSKRLTTGGDVYRSQIIGFFDGQGTVHRVEAVIDATVKPPRPVFTKNLL